MWVKLIYRSLLNFKCFSNFKIGRIVLSRKTLKCSLTCLWKYHPVIHLYNFFTKQLNSLQLNSLNIGFLPLPSILLFSMHFSIFMLCTPLSLPYCATSFRYIAFVVIVIKGHILLTDCDAYKVNVRVRFVALIRCLDHSLSIFLSLWSLHRL